MIKITKSLVKEKMMQENSEKNNEMTKSENIGYSIISFLLFGWVFWLIFK